MIMCALYRMLLLTKLNKVKPESEVSMFEKVNVAVVLYIIGFLDLFAVSLVIPLMSKHAKDIGASPSVAGMIGSVYGSLQLISSPLVGRWSDISGRRSVLMCCLLLASVGYFILGLSSTLFLLVLSRIPSGMFKHTQELARGYLADITPPEQHARVFGHLNAASSMGFIVGPLLGGHIAAMPGGFQLATFTALTIFLIIYGLFKHTQSLTKTYLTELVPKTQLSEALGIYYAVSSVGFIVGPTVAGHIADGPEGFCRTAIFTTCTFGINAGIVWLFLPKLPDIRGLKENQESQPEKKPKKTTINFHPLAFIESFRQIEWHHLWDIFLIRFLMGFAVLIYRNNFALMLDYKYQASTKVVGYITSYSGLIGTISGFFVGKIANFYQNDSKLLLHAGILQFVSIVCVTFSPSIWILGLSITPLSLANQVARVCSTNLTIHRGHGQERGALLGLGASILALARMLSPALGGFAQEFHLSGPSLVGSVFAGLGVLTMISVPQFKINDRHIDKQSKSE